MTRTKTPADRRGVLQSVHEIARDLHALGAIDVACLTDLSPFKPGEIQQLREQAQMSQGVFAMALNVTTGLLDQWERGERKPKGPALKLLALIRSKGIDAIL